MPYNSALALPLSAVLCLIASLILSGCATPASHWPTAQELPVQPTPPDPLIRFNGQRVVSPEEWARDRRPELKQLFQHYMYGFLPPVPTHMQFLNQGIYTDLLGGKATLKLIDIHAGPEGAPKIQLMVIVPNQRRGPVPVFLAMNFCGNHTLLSDPRVPLTQGWLYDSCKGCEQGHATENARGSQAMDWPISEIIDRGYALAAFCTTDIDSDRKDVSDGVYAWLAKYWKDPSIAAPANRGTIAAWAWGFHRCVDYLLRDPDIQRGQIAAVGHSRNGKTALLAAALDERIALAIPHQAGCGGSAPSRGKIGESVQRINTAFPHWFNEHFKDFSNQPERLPFDQNALVALCAPRPVLFSNAADDQWANPSGQFEILKAADPVYKFLGARGLESETPPPQGQLSAGRLGYYIREGKHSMTSGDWQVFLEFADTHFRNATR